jgi:hypothetical protein
VACSRAMADQTARAFPGARAQITYIHSGLRLDELPAPGNAADVTRPFVLSVCRQVAKKGTDTLLRAFAQVQRDVPGVALIIIGDGPELERNRALAAALASSSRSGSSATSPAARPCPSSRPARYSSFPPAPSRSAWCSSRPPITGGPSSAPRWEASPRSSPTTSVASSCHQMTQARWPQGSQRCLPIPFWEGNSPPAPTKPCWHDSSGKIACGTTSRSTRDAITLPGRQHLHTAAAHASGRHGGVEPPRLPLLRPHAPAPRRVAVGRVLLRLHDPRRAAAPSARALREYRQAAHRRPFIAHPTEGAAPATGTASCGAARSGRYTSSAHEEVLGGLASMCVSETTLP